jgi:hypothetical protein
MSKHTTLFLGLALAALATSTLLSSACSSEDETSDGSGEASSSSIESGDAESEDTDTGGGTAAIDCDQVLTATEVEALFGEPAVLEAVDPISNSEQLGQSTCTWTTVEEEDNPDDLASQLLVLQYYDGSTMSGANFYDPEVQYPDSEPLDIGDEGFVNADGSVDIGFLDGETSGFLSFTTIDLSGELPEATAKKDAVIELARTFHDRAG